MKKKKDEKRKDEKKKMKKEKMKKKTNRRRGFEPETSRLGSSLNNYATQHLTLNACNCQLFKSDLQPASWLT